MTIRCEVCNASGPFSELQAEEKMFGRGGSFVYLQCSNCETLFLKDVPADLGQFYPDFYYSFASSEKKTDWPTRLRQWLWDERLRAVKPYAIWSKLLLKALPNAGIEAVIRLNPQKQWNILDVGCGAGDLVRAMQHLGFTNALGVDAFVQKDSYHKGRLMVKKAQLEDLSGQFDLIMLHHAYEHLSQPIRQLQLLRKLLKPGGKLLLRFPTVSSEAFRRYGSNWVQLDAPRHLFLHSEKGMRLMAAEQGYKVLDFYTDAIAFQFWGSEWYARGGALFNGQTGQPYPVKEHFDSEKLRQMQAETEALNARNQGDQAVWVLANEG